MAQPIRCDAPACLDPETGQSRRAAMMVSTLANGATSAWCAEHWPVYCLVVLQDAAEAEAAETAATVDARLADVPAPPQARALDDEPAPFQPAEPAEPAGELAGDSGDGPEGHERPSPRVVGRPAAESDPGDRTPTPDPDDAQRPSDAVTEAVSSS